MRTAAKAGILAGVGAAAIALGQRLRTAGGADSRENHWLAVTVNCSPDRLTPADSLPEPLARLRDRIELRVRPAAGDKGTEMLALPTDEGLSRADLRQALRQAKSLIEAGIVIHPDTPGSTHPGPAGRLLGAVVGRAQKEGRL
jgi:hypothetical protein